ncbi:UDP-N-acetylglucosamine pyrophosphorylase [bacterium]|nr:MAG: UDP-N-acetylglucosamine pyrophosphorylase [bacterium]
MNLAVLVLAAGKGTRMESDLPKVLHPLRGRPLVAHVLDAALTLDPTRLICIVGHRAELVESEVQRSHASVEFVNQGEMLGTGHAVSQTKAALENFDGEVLVTCGDAPLLTSETLADLVARRRQDDAAAAMLVGRIDEPGRYGRVIMAEGGEVEKIVEWKDASEEERAVQTVNAGTYVFRSKDLWKQLARVTNDNASGEYYLTDVIGLLRQDGEKVVGILVSEREMTGINTRAELAELERQLEEEERLMAENEAMPS